MQALVKTAAERIALTSGIAAVARRTVRGRTLILAYHNVVPDGDEVRGDLSLHLSQRSFASHLDALARYGEVVPLSSVLEQPASKTPRFVITFDDAYAGALSAGVDELRRRGMPATVFVAPALLGGTTWWDMLADPVLGEVGSQTRDHAMTRLAGRGDMVTNWARDARVEPLRGATQTGLPSIGTELLLRRALEFDGLTLGSHSWSHVNLAAVQGEELERELHMPAEWLAERFPGRYLPWLSYPYGRYSPSTAERAMRAGYTAAVRVDGGWLNARRPLDPSAIPRLNIPRGLSARGFMLRASGIGSRGAR